MTSYYGMYHKLSPCTQQARSLYQHDSMAPTVFNNNSSVFHDYTPIFTDQPEHSCQPNSPPDCRGIGCIACTYWTSDKWLFGQVHLHAYQLGYHRWNATPYTSQQLGKLWAYGSRAKPVNNEWYRPKEKEIVLYINPLTKGIERVRAINGHRHVEGRQLILHCYM